MHSHNLGFKRLVSSFSTLLLTVTLLLPGMTAYAAPTSDDTSALEHTLAEQTETIAPETAKRDEESRADVESKKDATSASDALQAALDAGGEVVLTEDIETNGLRVRGSVVLDLNGHSITGSGDHTIFAERWCSFKIIGEGTIDNLSHGRAALFADDYARVTIDGDVKFTRSKEAGYYEDGATYDGGNSWYVIYNAGTMTINDGEVYSEGNFSSLICNKLTLTINGGKMSNGFVVVKNEGDLTVTDGHIEVTGTGGGGIYNYGRCEVSGGDVVLADTASNAVPIVALSSAAKASTTTVSGTAQLRGREDDQGRTIGILVGNESEEAKDAYAPVLKITGGTVYGDIMGNRSASVSVTNGNVYGGIRVGNTTKSVNVNGGSFYGKNEISSDNESALSVNGGTFADDPLGFVIQDGTEIGIIKSGGTDLVHYVGRDVPGAIKALSTGDYVTLLKGSMTFDNLPEGIGVHNTSGALNLGKTSIQPGQTVMTGDSHTLQQFIDMAEHGNGTIYLEHDYIEDITIDGTVIIDLNGHNITNVAGAALTVAPGGNLTIVGDGMVTSSVIGQPALRNDGSTYLCSGDIIMAAMDYTQCPVVINKGDFHADSGGVIGEMKDVDGTM